MVPTAIQTANIEPSALAQAIDRCAKHWWGVSLATKFLGFGIGACFSFIPPEPLPFILTGCTLLAEFSQYRSDAIKSTAQRLRRKIDLQDAFGWPIPAAEYSDILVRCPASVKVRAGKHPLTEPYFASTEPVGPTRALRNVAESAWWTKHLSELMARVCQVIVGLGLIGALIVLLIALQTTTEHTTQVNVARIVTGIFMLLLSLGLVKLAMNYSSLHRNSAASEVAADRALQGGNHEQVDALRILYDYHLSRALGPIIPTWIWQWHKDELNAIWKGFRNGKQ